jgi:formylglycine-generating enzyme
VKILLFNALIAASFASSAPNVCPPEMFLAPTGQFYMGRDHSMRPDESPRHLVKISAFCMDRTLVTNADFKQFVEKTGYVTTAENRGFGMEATEGMEDWKWARVHGANWRRPFGPEHEKDIPIQPDYPVVSVSWDDASKYCQTQGKRLPTEAEWEYAARAGRSDTRFPWGDKPERADGKLGLNFWQGETHQKNEMKDGYLYMSPVKAFPPNAWGMYDPVGNVWQWTADWYSPHYFKDIASPPGIKDPQGPPQGNLKVARGGSWWCSEKTCSAYGLFFRGKTKISAVFNNNGFRCAEDLPDY